MEFFDIFAWVVFLLMVSMVVGVVVLLGVWPGRVAHSRNHPQADAIAVGSWLTLFLGFVLWPVVAIWAYTKPAGDSAQLAELEKRLAALEAGATDAAATS
jgi:hypothetical protein